MEMSKLPKLDPGRDEIRAKQIQHDDTWFPLEVRCRHHVTKATESVVLNPHADAIHLSFATDGLGSYGFKYLPHRPFFGMPGMRREDLLNIHTELTMVHSVGVFGHIAIPTLETCGADMTLNAVYRLFLVFHYVNFRFKIIHVNRSIFKSMKLRPGISRIKILYGTMDNTVSTNKCWTMMCGMATLVALGIAEKVI